MKKSLLLDTYAQSLNLALSEIGSHAEHDAMQLVLNNIEIGLERVSHIVHKMSIAKESNKAEYQSSDVNTCIKATVQNLSKHFPSNISIELSLSTLPYLCVDVYKISQLLTNLIMNAKEAVNHNGDIRISSVHKNNCIEISVSDNGCGIEKHLQSLIFDPCYSTKKEAKETGLGLAISKDIALEHGGDLHVSSICNEGSVFTLQLPLSDITIH